MQPLPTADLRSNVATWAVPVCLLPAAAARLMNLLPPELYDPDFRGQELATTYFDTLDFDLRKARHAKDKYLTLRIRYYAVNDAYALSAKTEDAKFRQEISPHQAGAFLRGVPSAAALPLPPDLLARLLDLAGDAPLFPIVTLCFYRYAREDSTGRLTLDTAIRTDTDKRFPYAVLEQKSADPNAAPYPDFFALGLHPTKLSKFLWSTKP